MRTVGRLSLPRREDARSVRAAEHALQVAQVGELRLQLEGRDGGLHETYHVFTTHPEFNKFGEFNGWAKAQGKHSNIGYDAPKDLEETKAKMRLGTGRSAHLDRGDAGLHHGGDQHHHHARRWSTPRSGWSTNCRKARRPTRCSSTGWPRRAATTRRAAWSGRRSRPTSSARAAPRGRSSRTSRSARA